MLAELITRARITTGNAALGPGVADNPAGGIATSS